MLHVYAVQYCTACSQHSITTKKNNATHTKTMRLNVTSFQQIVCSHFFFTPNYGTVCSTAACTTRNFLYLTSTVWFTSAILKTNCERSAMEKHGKATGQCECNALSSARDKGGHQCNGKTGHCVDVKAPDWERSKQYCNDTCRSPTFHQNRSTILLFIDVFISTQYCSCCTTLSL